MTMVRRRLVVLAMALAGMGTVAVDDAAAVTAESGSGIGSGL